MLNAWLRSRVPVEEVDSLREEFSSCADNCQPLESFRSCDPNKDNLGHSGHVTPTGTILKVSTLIMRELNIPLCGR